MDIIKIESAESFIEKLKNGSNRAKTELRGSKISSGINTLLKPTLKRKQGDTMDEEYTDNDEKVLRRNTRKRRKRRKQNAPSSESDSDGSLVVTQVQSPSLFSPLIH